MSSLVQQEINEIKALLGRGEHLIAYDVANRALKKCPNESQLLYFLILSLARSGAYKKAQELYDLSALKTSKNEDYLSLGARLAKDVALAEKGKAKAGKLIEAASKYKIIFDKTAGAYPAVNAATLYFLADEIKKSYRLANMVLDLCSKQGSSDGINEYYRLVTIVEAKIILGKVDDIVLLLEQAVGYANNDWSAISGTRNQLSLLLKGPEAGLLLAPLTSPAVIHYSGHMITTDDSGRFIAKNEEKVRVSIEKELDRLNVGFGYGSIASGADIMFVEALIKRHADVHVVLPFEKNEFINISIKPAGEEWLTRFKQCLSQVKYVSYATEDNYLGDTALFHYASRLAMGLAIQKANNLSAHVEQIAVWDGEPPTGPAGTSADIYFWHSKQLPSTLIDSNSGSLLEPQYSERTIIFTPQHNERQPMTMLFGDIKGFSKLTDKEIPIFVQHILGTIGEIIENYEDAIVLKNTWGDGIFLVWNKAIDAAECALELQQALARINLIDIGLPEYLAIRIGGHFGPVYEIFDPILKQPNYFGSHISRAARIEPVTPPGEVYVTRQFAAELAIEQDINHTTEYVGIMPAAKSYGELPMYVLRHKS